MQRELAQKMDLYYIDYISISGKSWLYRAPAWVKMIVLVALIGVLLWLRYIWISGAILLAVISIAAAGRLPMKLFFTLMLYPSFFLVIVLLSATGLNYVTVLLLLIRVFAITGAVVTLLLSTSYPKIFGALSRVLPGILVAALFFTYRSIFIVVQSVNDVWVALHLRGGIDWKWSRKSLRNFGQALGHVLVHIIDSSGRKADSLKVRGFSGRIYYLDKRE